ncbi:MAG: peroxide stress protein YaaA [Planctomycetota bacterium]|nr:peroxide stress protein YaaA [Planctomycetota bacterium]
MPGFTAILSPAKSLDMAASDIPNGLETSNPRLGSRTRALAEILSTLSAARLGTLMSISTKLSELNHERWQAFGARSNPRGPAAMCFRGDVYQGLEAWTMNARALAWAQDHLRILSGLYGLLRPLDRIQPHRLEMGTRLKTAEAGDLYEFWGDDIARTLGKDIAANGSETLVNLASDEYSKAARLDTLDVPVIDVKFLQIDGGKEKFISFHAKQSRGLMVRWMADHRPRTLKALRDFDAGGYEISDASTADTLVFTRPKPPPLRAP